MLQDDKVMADLLEGKKPIWLPLLSGSMAPSLLPGDELFIEPKTDTFKSGDIAVFFARGKFFSHRVICSFHIKKMNYILEMGDANHKPGFIPSGKALGRVTQFCREKKIQMLTDPDKEKSAKKIAVKSFFHFITIGWMKR